MNEYQTWNCQIGAVENSFACLTCFGRVWNVPFAAIGNLDFVKSHENFSGVEVEVANWFPMCVSTNQD